MTTSVADQKTLIPIEIDLTIVLDNSAAWSKDFFNSLVDQTYPLTKIHIFISVADH